MSLVIITTKPACYDHADYFFVETVAPVQVIFEAVAFRDDVLVAMVPRGAADWFNGHQPITLAAYLDPWIVFSHPENHAEVFAKNRAGGPSFIEKQPLPDNAVKYLLEDWDAWIACAPSWWPQEARSNLLTLLKVRYRVT